MARQEQINKNKNDIGCGTVALIIIGIFFCMSLDSNEEKDEQNTPKKNTTEVTTEIQKTFYDNLCEHISSMDAENVVRIITTEIGYDESEIVFDSKLDGSDVFVIYLDSTQYKMTIYDGTCRIWNDMYVLYEDGKLKMSKQDVDNRKISYDERATYYSFATEIIKSCLKNPDSADFPSLYYSGEVAMSRNKDLVVVQSYVVAKNSFNAEIKSQYTVEFQVIDIENFLYNTIYINIDGESSGEYIKLEDY